MQNLQQQRVSGDQPSKKRTFNEFMKSSPSLEPDSNAVSNSSALLTSLQRKPRKPAQPQKAESSVTQAATAGAKSGKFKSFGLKSGKQSFAEQKRRRTAAI